LARFVAENRGERPAGFPSASSIEEQAEPLNVADRGGGEGIRRRRLKRRLADSREEPREEPRYESKNGSSRCKATKREEKWEKGGERHVIAHRRRGVKTKADEGEKTRKDDGMSLESQVDANGRPLFFSPLFSYPPLPPGIVLTSEGPRFIS